MANHKSSEKRARQTLRKTAVNNRRKKSVKTVEKKLSTAIQTKDASLASTLLKSFSSLVDRAAKNRVVSKKHANRKKSRLAARISALTK